VSLRVENLCILYTNSFVSLPGFFLTVFVTARNPAYLIGIARSRVKDVVPSYPPGGSQGFRRTLWRVSTAV
jgi:hypothetical protein